MESYSAKMEQTADTHENMNEPQKPNAKWREPDAKDFTADDFIYTKCPEKANL